MELVNTVSTSEPLSQAAGIAVGAVMGASGSRSPSFSLGVPADDLTPFERERAAFFLKLRELMTTHAGEYVVISGGQVAAHGTSENETARRFFHDHPDAADVYIGFVGEQRPAYQIRPASRR
jgi:hypothetical protein